MKKQEILTILEKRIKTGKSIRYTDIKKEDSSLLYKIEKLGGVASLAHELGISRVELVEKYGLHTNILPPLSENEILNRLTYLKSIGRLTTSAMRTDFSDTRLEASLKRLYGSVKEGLEYFNMRPDSKAPTKKELLKKIKKLAESNNVAYADMIKLDATLMHSIGWQFQMSWHEFLEHYEIPFQENRQAFTREKIIARLKKVEAHGNGMNYALIKKYDVSILNYVWDNYESIADFFQDYGYDPNTCCDFNSQKSKGFMFEKLFKEVLDCLSIENAFNKYYTKDLRPDFQLLNKNWIDCKLSSWTSTIESTIEKYTPHCNSLMIVFLRGEERHLSHIKNEKVTFRKVDYYYPFLKKINRHDLIEKIEDLIV